MAQLTRVDFEAALHAALVHERFDVSIFDPVTTGLSREQVELCFRVHGRQIPLLELDDLATLGSRVARVLELKRQ